MLFCYGDMYHCALLNSNGIAARRYKFSRYGFLVQTILPDGPATEYVQVYEYHPPVMQGIAYLTGQMPVKGRACYII